ncbi:MAG: acetamidase/formamidase family protein [Alphaproteobacteria bacterium]
MSEHYLPATPETVRWGSFSAAYPAVLTVRSGDRVTMDCVSGAPEDFPGPPFRILDDHREITEKCRRGPGPHFMTGPVWVEGAEPGDVLEVRVIDIRLRTNWGWNLIRPHRGALPADFPYLKCVHIEIDETMMTAAPPWGGTLHLRPFFGVLGVAPPASYGEISSIEPREHGGNIDLKDLTVGTTLYLPSWNKGALFSAGDGHGMQGDGEVCLTALETCLSGTFELHLRKDLSLDLPEAETPTHVITLAFDPDLDDAATRALRDMIKLITVRTGLSAEDAYRLCSLAADLRVTQVVDGNKGIHCMIEKAILDDLIATRR